MKKLKIPQMSTEETIIYRIIQGRKGQENAITAGKISQMTGMNTRFVRRVIKRLIEKRGVPIAAASDHPSGYFWPVSSAEILAYRSNLIHRISSLAARLRSFDKVTAEQILSVTQMDFFS